MDDTAAMCPAFEETVVFLKHFAELEDPRQRGKVVYPLQEILLLCLTAVVAGAESITAISPDSTRSRPPFLKRGCG